jgi:tetratricopeptide (TPR) repeat protein
MNKAIRTAVIAGFSCLAGARLLAQAERVTFTKDVAPILQDHCGNCHRPGQVGPFSVLTFEDVRPRAKEIAQVTKSRVMPPWKPEPGHGQFVTERRLTDAQIDIIQQWVSQGMMRGAAADTPPARQWHDGWQLGMPDVVVSMPQPYLLPVQTRDVFRTFVIPIPVKSAAYVRAVEFLPGNYGVVHHANLKIDRTRLSRRRDEDEPAPGYEGGGSREAHFPDGMFLGWTPGQSPRVSPEGMSWHLEPGSDLVVELHLMPGSKPEPVQVSVGLFFTDRAPTRTGYMLRLGRQDIDIPAGRRDYVNTDSYTLPVDVEALAVQPHAHYLAKEVRAWATLPGGTIEPLIYIKDWDFHWQDVYTYSRPVALPKGTRIEMQYTYDNTEGNRRNPNRPPRRVTFGQTSASEMGSLWLQVVPRSPGDLVVLERDFAPKILRDDIAGNEKWLEVEPHNAELRAELAACYLEANRFDEALTQFREAVRLDPSAGRQYDVARVLLLQEKYDEAESFFREALSRRPAFAEAIYGLAVVLHGQGRIEDAIELYQQALNRDPDNVAGHYNLGRAFAARGQNDRAIQSYQKAIELAPEDADARQGLARALVLVSQLSEAMYQYRRTLEIDPTRLGALLDLAWIIATAPNIELRVPSEGVRLAERAVAMTDRKNATALDTLAAAYARADRLSEAIETAEEAIKIARATGDAQLAAQISARLETYRATSK